MIKKVTFEYRPTIYVQYECRFACQQNRKSDWEPCARDREWFKRRVIKPEHILNTVLNERHRERVLESLHKSPSLR